MKLNCPECDTTIPSENINIQKMVAVCPNCGTVFPFDTQLQDQPAKSKRRKVYRPQNLELRDTDHQVQMAFRTNFRLSQNESFRASAMLSVMFTFMTLLMASRFSANTTAAVLTGGFALFTVALYYWAALIAYNKTVIDMTDEKISVSRAPIPVLFGETTEVYLSGVTAIEYEETPISKKKGYDLPRYNVWAKTADGSRKLIVSDVIDDYAAFITQRLNEQLASDMDADADVTRLVDEAENSAEHPRLSAVRQSSNGQRLSQ